MSKEEKKFSKPVPVIALVTALCLIGDSMLYIALPIYYEKVGLQSLWEVGLILSLNRLVRIPLNPLVGMFYRKLSLKTGMLISVILAVVTTIGYGVAYGLIAWIILENLVPDPRRGSVLKSGGMVAPPIRGVLYSWISLSIQVRKTV